MSRARSRQYLTVLEDVVVMSSITYENVLEYLETLSEEEQQEVFDLVKKRRIERRRSEIADNARKTFEAMEKGTAKRGSLIIYQKVLIELILRFLFWADDK